MIADDYMKYVSEAIKEYKSIGLMLRTDRISPDAVNTALANFHKVYAILVAEYQKAKFEFLQLELEYKQWYDEKFISAKDKVRESYATNKIKPSVTEFETQLRVDNREAYYDYQERLMVCEAKMRFQLRLLDSMDSNSKILIAISTNMRSEMHSLSLDKRMNQSPEEKSAQRREIEE